MAKKVCRECGRIMGAFSQSSDKDLCLTCYQDIHVYKDDAYFDLVKPTEDMLLSHRLFDSMRKIIPIGLIVGVAWMVGSLILGVWLGGMLGLILAALFVVRPMVQKLNHPLDRRRANVFMVPMMVSLMLSYFIILFKIMFSSPQVSMVSSVRSTIFLTLLLSVLISMAIGIGFTFLLDKRTIEKHLNRYHKWAGTGK